MVLLDGIFQMWRFAAVFCQIKRKKTTRVQINHAWVDVDHQELCVDIFLKRYQVARVSSQINCINIAEFLFRWQSHICFQHIFKLVDSQG